MLTDYMISVGHSSPVPRSVTNDSSLHGHETDRSKHSAKEVGVVEHLPIKLPKHTYWFECLCGCLPL